MKSQKELTGLTSEEHKQRKILNALRYDYFETNKERFLNILTEEEKFFVQTEDADYVKIKRYDLSRLIESAFYELFDKPTDRLVVYKYINYLLAGKYIIQNPTSHISAKKHVIKPCNDTLYFIKVANIDAKLKALTDKWNAFWRAKEKNIQLKPKSDLLTFIQSDGNGLATTAFNGLTCFDSVRSTDSLTNQQPATDTEAVKDANQN